MKQHQQTERNRNTLQIKKKVFSITFESIEEYNDCLNLFLILQDVNKDFGVGGKIIGNKLNRFL